ncbi:ABC-2 family transporter protein [Carpediemonas membranifera]|uniref:ABC-2 family transporter protein n=1 Tax=Carpediemonas membranifera TaxID=201153 RepID=A0A8J6DZM1_9EUKA|nr:ABC-2 family transporter protein [Carpediemonas membranifera]|eukprot:KAG9390923.1 ABC-2 family transporter protein [Carpediemonas membranifera]
MRRTQGVDVGKLDDSGASGFLAGIENSTINGVVSPRFVPASEAAANTFFLDSWDNHNETLGAVVFSKADSTGLDVKILVNDTVTQPNSAGSFSSTHLLPLNDMLTNAWLQTVSPALSYVSHSTADYPREEDEAAVDYTALSLVEPLGMALHMALPSILVGLAADISLGMRRHLSILGVRRTVYWTVNYGVAFCVMCIQLTPIIISGLAFDIRFFTLNNFFLYFVLFVAFAANLASTAMMIAPLLRNVHVAVIVGTVVAIVLNESACIVSYLSDQFSSTELIPLVLPSVALTE